MCKLCLKRMPFELRNPFEFLLAMAIQCIMLGSMLLIGACILTLGTGTYLYAIAMSKCIKENLFTIIESCRNKNKRHLICEQLVEFIDFHTNAKQLSKFSNIVQGIVQILLSNK